MAAVVVMGAGAAANAIVWRITVAVLRPTDEQGQRSTALRRHRETRLRAGVRHFRYRLGTDRRIIRSYRPAIGRRLDGPAPQRRAAPWPAAAAETSGTAARRIEIEQNALRLTKDEWVKA
jgi:hypothetical protein